MLIYPDWPAPQNVLAYSTTREGGVSTGVYRGLNLGQHVGDESELVQHNRQLLPAASDLVWLQQVHGSQCVALDSSSLQDQAADASYTKYKSIACVVMTADCLPVLICDQHGTEVAAVHCGWRGLAAGVLSQTLARFTAPNAQLLAWLGPAIGPQAFEVGEDVKQAFAAGTQSAFIETNRPGKYLADIYQLAKFELAKAGVERVFGGDYCTYSQPELFYSYRRDGQTGRMASAIVLTS